MAWFFVFFLVSGSCSILYELVWLRLAMAQFTVTTPFVSIVLSVFMLGLGGGSWLAGRFTAKRGSVSGLRLYALVELLIGCSAIAVPYELAGGRALVEMLAQRVDLSAGAYYTVSGLLIAASLAPWCACMGATFPFAMLAIRQRFAQDSPRSFSYLYVANVLGAVIGSVVPLLLVETWGFRGTLRAGLAGNLALAACALALSRQRKTAQVTIAQPPAAVPGERRYLWLLFATGLTTMGAEVVWVRLYTPYLGTVVYAFAGILGTYLASTYVGSALYRKIGSGRLPRGGAWLALLGLAAVVPLFACDPRRGFPELLRLILGVLPFSAGAGFLTPMWVDLFSRGDPERAGRGYAVNVLGCIAGPLVAGFVLLPLVGERFALFAFALPWLVIGLVAPMESSAQRRSAWAAALAAIVVVVFARNYDRLYTPRKILRDHTATVVAGGSAREEKQLLINGVGITSLTPITKVMAHLPLALLSRPPERALVVCFGMGTTHRSVLSWGIHSTAVELTPSVPALFSFFHADGDLLLASPRSKMVIDDGRFYLERTRDQFDVIVIDPPPPIGAAGSSLLYSKEFYAVAKPRLREGGILQQWLLAGDSATRASVARAIGESFPYVRVYGSFEGWGYHILASQSPIAALSAEELTARLPARAASDLVEWGPASTPEGQFALVLSQETQLDDLIREEPSAPALTDDRPINEYYVLRRYVR